MSDKEEFENKKKKRSENNIKHKPDKKSAIKPDEKLQSNPDKKPQTSRPVPPSRRGILSILICLLSILAVFFAFRRDANRSYDYQQFKTDYTKQAEEKIVSENEKIHGIYIYGPYINLKKGAYEFVVNYEGDTEFPYEVTFNMGKEKLEEGTLGANKTRETFSVTVPEDIENHSVEFRTYYDGKGTFAFYSLDVKRYGWIKDALIIVLMMAAAMACTVFFFGSISPLWLLYTGAFYTVTGTALSKDLRLGAAVFILHIGWLLLVLRLPRLRKEIGSVKAYEILILLLSAFLLLSACNVLRYSGGVESIDFVKKILPDRYILQLMGIFHILILLRLLRGRKQTSSWILLLCAVFFGFSCILNYRNVYFSIGVTAILGFFIYYLLKNDPDMLRRAFDITDYRRPFIAVCVLSFVMAAYLICITVCRYRVYGAPNFDMGIFSQMFEYMARTGKPLTTCERGYLLSHFYIHFSPIFYVLLPFYMLFRSPECLLVLQSLFVFAAAVPLFLICRHYKLRPVIAMLVSCIYIVVPATQQPLFYDFHEYKFIPFFLFWFLYFYLEKKNLRALLFLILTLMIKEDVAIYLIIFSLYRIAAEKDYRRGSVVLAISGIYFAAVMVFIQSHGLGLMEGHYGMYYLPGERGMFALARNILLEPGRFVRQVFDEENIQYIFYTLGVFLFIPLGSKDFKRLILLIPYVAFGLMTDYAYQHDVGFQYVYGPTVLILLLFILNLREKEESRQVFICLACICAGIIMSYTYRGDGYVRYIRNYRLNREAVNEKEAFLKEFYTEGSVTADSFLVAHMTHLPEVYDYDEKLKKTDYYILSANGDYSFNEVYEELGYELVDEQHGMKFYKLTKAE